jgi:hypothetical protein
VFGEWEQSAEEIFGQRLRKDRTDLTQDCGFIIYRLRFTQYCHLLKQGKLIIGLRITRLGNERCLRNHDGETGVDGKIILT